jgi:hypothetical protein
VPGEGNVICLARADLRRLRREDGLEERHISLHVRWLWSCPQDVDQIRMSFVSDDPESVRSRSLQHAERFPR